MQRQREGGFLHNTLLQERREERSSYVSSKEADVADWVEHESAVRESAKRERMQARAPPLTYADVC